MTTESKVVAVRLPVDHPVFNLPQRSRAETIRRWLEMGMNLSRLNKTIELESKKLDRVLELLQEMKEKQNIPSSRTSNSEEPKVEIENQEDEIARNLDLTSLNDAIKDFFLDEEGGNQ